MNFSVIEKNAEKITGLTLNEIKEISPEKFLAPSSLLQNPIYFSI